MEKLTVSQALAVVKKHFDTYKKTVKSGSSASNQVRNYYNHFDKMLASHGFDSEDNNTQVVEFFEQLIKDDEFISEDNMPQRWSPKTWGMSFLSMIDCANIIKDTLVDKLGAKKFQTIIDKSTNYSKKFDKTEIEAVPLELIEEGEDTENTEEGEEPESNEFDFSNLSKLFGNFAGGGKEPTESKSDIKLEIMRNMMMKLAETEQHKWANILCETIAELL